MNVEQKAKAYDEALERYKARQEYECQKVHEFIEYLFPELKESKDERIRKALLALVEWSKSYSASGITANEAKEMISWLEKQGKPIDKIVKRAMNEKQRVLLTETNGDANIDWDTRSLQDVKLLLEYGLDYIKKLEALDSATENCAYSEYQDCLRELIRQLKKLKG